MRRSVTDMSPLHQINITPLLDVFLVLLVALIALVPMAADDLVAQAEAKLRQEAEAANGPVHVLEVGPASLQLDGNPVRNDNLSGLTGTVRIVSGAQTPYGRVLSVAQRVSALPGVRMRFAPTADVAPAAAVLPPPILPAPTLPH